LKLERRTETELSDSKVLPFRIKKPIKKINYVVVCKIQSIFLIFSRKKTKQMTVKENKINIKDIYQCIKIMKKKTIVQIIYNEKL
jgi:hypothetical protein